MQRKTIKRCQSTSGSQFLLSVNPHMITRTCRKDKLTPERWHPIVLWSVAGTNVVCSAWENHQQEFLPVSWSHVWCMQNNIYISQRHFGNTCCGSKKKKKSSLATISKGMYREKKEQHLMTRTLCQLLSNAWVCVAASGTGSVVQVSSSKYQQILEAHMTESVKKLKMKRDWLQ